MQLEKTNVLLKALVRLNLERLETPMIDKISILDALGMTPSEIAEVLGTTANTVSVMKVKLRKRKEKGAKGATKEVAQETPSTTV